jgi:hypothetical protein
MTHEQVLLNRVGDLRTRIRLLLAQQWVCLGLTFGALASLLLVACTRFRWWTDAQDYMWVLFLIGGIAGLVIGLTRKITPMVAAQIADERAGLKERLSTAVELSSGASRSEVAEAQIEDAARHAAELRPAQVLPWRVPLQVRYLAAAVALLLAAIILPDLPLFHSVQERLDRETMQAEGAKIEQVAKKMETELKRKGEEDNAEILRRIAQNMKQLGKDQKLGRISKKQALLEMNELQKQLKDAENKISGGEGKKSWEKVASDLQEAAQKQERQGGGEAAKELRRMAENVRKRDMDAAKQQLEDIARKLQSGKMSPKEAQETADMLQEMAQSMSGSTLDQASEQMKEAAKQLQQAAKQAEKFQQQMAEAKTDAERQQLQQQMAQAMQQGMAQAGEQCEQAGGT